MALSVTLTEITHGRTDAARALALLDQASQALADGDVEQTRKLLNASHHFSQASRDRLERWEREAQLTLAEVGC